MRIIMMACSVRGFLLMGRAAESLARRLPGAQIIQEGRCAHVPGYEDGTRLSQTTEKWFFEADALVFFTAAGIAVRCIAPFVKDKFTDPAVLVVDEGGSFCISLLSGHVGGANRLCRILAEEMGALPVITTATDIEKRFAVDVFAVEKGLCIHSREAAKRVSADLVAGETVKMYVDPCCGTSVGKGWSADSAAIQITQKPTGCFAAEGAFGDGLPAGLAMTKRRQAADILLSPRKMPGDRPDALFLIPRTAALGVGCRKGAEAGCIREAVRELLRQTGVFREALFGIASIDLKKQEAGLLSFAKEWELPTAFYSARELKKVPGRFSASEFVEKTTGVDNVCERSAMRLAGGGAFLLAGKFSKKGVTAALAVRQLSD